MLTKFICKLFKLIKRDDIVDRLSKQLYLMAMSKDTLKHKWDSGEISEWTYYKKLWQLMGRLSMLEETLKLLMR